MSFFKSPKMWKSQWGKSGLRRVCWSVSQPNLWSLSLTRLAVWGGRYNAKEWFRPTAFHGFWLIARRNNLNQRETNHISLLLPPFPMLDEHTLYYAHLQSNKKTTVRICAFSLCISPTLQMVVSMRNNIVASFCEECVFLWMFGFIWLPLRVYCY